MGFTRAVILDDCSGHTGDGFHQGPGPDLSISIMGFIERLGHNRRGFHIQHGP